MEESKIIEYKREYISDIKYTVVAFANTDGGKVYIGIDDDGSVCGVENVDETMLQLTNMVRDVVRPDVTLFTECTMEKMDGKNVVVLTIQRGTSRPYYLHGKGIRPEGVYVRQGASSVPASETAILHMIRETAGDCYEESRSLNQQLTFEKTSDYFQKKNLEFGESQKRSLHLIGEDGTYTNLGLLLSDQCTHTIKLAVFEGSKKTVFRDRCELTGSLLEQLEQAYAYIDRYNRTRSEFQGLDRIDKRDYPAEALREALLNAIVHRDYAISGSTLISIFDDRIEIVTIGGLVKGISFDDIMLGVSMPRNQHLANVFYRLRLIEAYGTGLMKINEAYADYSVKSQIQTSDNAFKITLPNTNFKEYPAVTKQSEPAKMVKEETYYAASRQDRETVIIKLFKEQETIVRKDIETALNVSQATAVLIVRDLVERGVLVKEGNGKYMRYRLGE